MQSATVAYMTGTGNTWRAAARVAETLGGRGWSTELVEIRRGERRFRGIFEADLLVLCFPVFSFGMPILVHSVLRRLRGKGKPAGIFATWGGSAGAALLQAAGFLRRHGFRVLATRGASYPFNWSQVIEPTDPATSRVMTKEGDEEAKRFTLDLIGSPERHRLQNPRAAWVIFGLPVWWMYTAIGRYGLGGIFAADEKCTACGTCARDCPARAITMAGSGDARRPRWNARCQGCSRCVNLCPERAIQSSRLRAVVQIVASIVIDAAAIVGLNRLAALAALPRYISLPAWIILLVAAVVYLMRLQVTALEPILFRLESLPGLRRRIGASWTARYGRNFAEGFTSRSGSAPRRTRTRRR